MLKLSFRIMVSLLHSFALSFAQPRSSSPIQRYFHLIQLKENFILFQNIFPLLMNLFRGKLTKVLRFSGEKWNFILSQYRVNTRMLFRGHSMQGIFLYLLQVTLQISQFCLTKLPPTLHSAFLATLKILKTKLVCCSTASLFLFLLSFVLFSKWNYFSFIDIAP